MKRESILGYPVDALTMEEALSWIKEQVKGEDSKIIAVTNANKMWLAHKDERIASFIKKADLIIPEYAIVWAGKRLGVLLTHIGGITLLRAFLPFAEKESIRAYFLGAKIQVNESLIQNLRNNYPLLSIAGYHHGYLSDDQMVKKVLVDIREKKPDILFIAMGSPKQEMLICEIKKMNIVPIVMGVGGSFDVLSGDKKDAPSWARSKGLEWLYRIFQDPIKWNYWKRYIITNTYFIYLVFAAKYFRK
jgi:N-acetylglucosaminyldiphosphoundecaprenol N-acetyl-beta-D-mannosaminyltransferase